MKNLDLGKILRIATIAAIAFLLLAIAIENPDTFGELGPLSIIAGILALILTFGMVILALIGLFKKRKTKTK